MDAHALR
jgi:hypothetical protein